MMGVTNVIEQIIRQQLDEMWEQKERYQLDGISKTDVFAIVLNSIPPRYATRDKGVAFIKAEYLDPQLQADCMSRIIEAIEFVKNNPVNE